MKSLQVEVVIVGAGLSGLAVARALIRRGVRVCVLEARERVGGRTLSQAVGPATLDLGGQWLGARQPRLSALVEELGLATFPTFHQGKKLIDLGAGVRSYRGSLPAVSFLELLRLQKMLWRLRWTGRGIDPRQPWRGRAAGALDSVSVAQWASQSFADGDARKLVDLLVRSVWSSESHELSALYLLAYGKAAGGVPRLAEVRGGAQERRFVDGAQTLSLRLASEFHEHVHLGSPVREIAWSSDGARVSADGLQVRARRVVLALPPALVPRIHFDPPLPVARAALGEGARMGRTIKCLVFYERAFWREAGLSGESLLHGGPCVFTYDNTSHDGAVPALVAFITGDEVSRWGPRTESERRAAVTAQLVRFFGPHAASPTGYLERNWSDDPWSGGCPVGILGPELLTRYGESLRAPAGCLHFAGTETATVWTGYLEGALQSAERVVAELP